jgi:dephospho-CoA kinase
MHVIALTGGIASGKSTLLSALQSLGAPVSDADRISHSLTAPGGEALPSIREAFGDKVFHQDGTLDRKALAEMIFTDEGARRRLEGILHPMVARVLNRELDAFRQAGHLAAVVDIPLLYESGMESLADEVWCAYIPKKEQIRRLRIRDGITQKQALQRLSSQMDLREKRRRADVVIRTDGTIAQSAAQVTQLWRETLRKLGGTAHE